ncbi:hypothetical protein [uncultured Corynebacterium sp.]|uniref:hypothetical protein n=1 Tax=uncultured Corynebacterium sp. TaxID=159447 RepID=UPI0025F1360C|nr:hypothetical protein [uncultured Corynebacterium sp.]
MASHTDNPYLPYLAMEFRRIARMNKQQLWSIVSAFTPNEVELRPPYRDTGNDESWSVTILALGLSQAWQNTQTITEDQSRPGRRTVRKVTKIIYSEVFNTARQSLGALDRAEEESGSQDRGISSSSHDSTSIQRESEPPHTTDSPSKTIKRIESLALYVMACYSPLSFTESCEILGTNPEEGTQMLDNLINALQDQ